MNKKVWTSALAAIAGVGLLAGSASAAIINDRATPVAPVNNSLQNTLNSIMVNPFDVIDDQSNAAIFSPVDTSAMSTFVFTDWSSGVDQSSFELGIYSFADPSKTLTIFGGSMTSSQQTLVSFLGDGSVQYFGNTASNVDGFGKSFGFYYTASASGSGGPLTTVYSEDDKNGSYGPAFLAFQGDGSQYLDPAGVIGSTPLDENDWLFGFDSTSLKDYNDAVFMVEEIMPVPEPATMLLFGTGLAGLAGISRRRKKK